MTTEINPATAAVETVARTPASTGPRLVDYPLVLDAEGNISEKMTGTPADFDHLKHKRIREAAFTDKSTYMEHQADILDRKSAALRAEAHELRTAGPMLKAKKKFLAMQKQLAKLQAELEEGGMDVEALGADTDAA